MPRILLTLTALTTAIVVASGCGSEGASSSDAASLAPAGSLVYGEATLRPEGDRKAAIDALVSKFPGDGGAGERIRTLMEKAFAEADTDLSYSEDIEPWLGDEAAFFVSRAGTDGKEADAAVLVATEDEDATVEAIEKDGDAKTSDYNGTDLYESLGDDGAAAVVDGWLVLGTPAAVKAAIDVADGGDPIDEDDAYEKALDSAPEERLGFMYVNTPAFADELQKSPGGAAFGQFRRFFSEPLIATVDADEHGIRFEGTVPASLLTGFPIVAEGTDLTAGLPADSWLAMGQPDLGKTIDSYLELAGSAVGGRDVIAEQFEASTGLDLEEAVGWMGDWALFVRGTSVEDLDGALMVETSDEAASGRVIDAIARVTRQSGGSDTTVRPLELSGGAGVTVRGPGLTQPVHMFQRDGKVVFAYGDAAARDALDPGETLGDSAAFGDAEAALGGDYDVSFYLAMEPILQLVESTPSAEDEDWQEARPYLEPLGAIVGGARKDGDQVHSAFGVTVK